MCSAAVLAGRYHCVRLLAYQVDLFHTVVGKVAGDVQPLVAAFATVADAIVYPAGMYELFAVHRVLNAVESVDWVEEDKKD